MAIRTRWVVVVIREKMAASFAIYLLLGSTSCRLNALSYYLPLLYNVSKIKIHVATLPAIGCSNEQKAKPFNPSQCIRIPPFVSIRVPISQSWRLFLSFQFLIPLPTSLTFPPSLILLFVQTIPCLSQIAVFWF